MMWLWISVPFHEEHLSDTNWFMLQGGWLIISQDTEVMEFTYFPQSSEKLGNNITEKQYFNFGVFLCITLKLERNGDCWIIFGLWKFESLSDTKSHFKSIDIGKGSIFLAFPPEQYLLYDLCSGQLTSIIWMMPFPRSALLSGHSLVLIGNRHS